MERTKEASRRSIEEQKEKKHEKMLLLDFIFFDIIFVSLLPFHSALRFRVFFFIFAHLLLDLFFILRLIYYNYRVILVLLQSVKLAPVSVSHLPIIRADFDTSLRFHICCVCCNRKSVPEKVTRFISLHFYYYNKLRERSIEKK